MLISGSKRNWVWENVISRTYFSVNTVQSSRLSSSASAYDNSHGLCLTMEERERNCWFKREERKADVIKPQNVCTFHAACWTDVEWAQRTFAPSMFAFRAKLFRRFNSDNFLVILREYQNSSLAFCQHSHRTHSSDSHRFCLLRNVLRESSLNSLFTLFLFIPGMVSLDEKKATCRVIDQHPDTKQKKFSFLVSPATSVESFIQQVSTQYSGYKQYEIVLESRNVSPNQTLSSVI